jgi:hypothetical protein
VDQIGTANHMIPDKIRIDGKALRLLSWLMSAVVVCGSLGIADRLITRQSVAKISFILSSKTLSSDALECSYFD